MELYHLRTFVAMAEALLAEAGSRPKSAAFINDERTIRSLVASGRGLSLLREDMVGQGGEDLAVWPGGALGIPVNLVALAARADEPEVKALMEAAARVWGLDCAAEGP